MTTVTSKALNKSINIKRVLGKYSQGEEGPAFVITAGVHGNEPSGIFAFMAVIDRLEREKLPFRGELTGLAGNLAALDKGVRFIDKDLNRVCFVDTDQDLKHHRKPDLQEEEEFFSLVQEFERAQHEKVTELVFMDLHTTSSASQPYISVNKDKKCFDFTKGFPMFVVRGIEKYIPGHVDFYLHAKGHKGCTVEAGQHDAATSIENHEAAIWLGLVEAGCLDKNDLSDYNRYYSILNKTLGAEGNVSYEVIYRYDIAEGENFKMEPGFANFQKIGKGEKLAISNGLEVVSEWDATIFMPLYQAQGKDGFFIVKKVD